MGTTMNAYNRLNEIWSDWGLPIEPSHTEVHKKVLGQISDWLVGPESSAERVVRATQALLINPERPDGRQRASLAEVFDLLRENWAGFGGGERDLMLLQAMLLAAWPQDQSQGEFQLVQLLDSAWDVMLGRQKQQQRLVAWRNSTFHMRPMKGEIWPKFPAERVPVRMHSFSQKIDQPDIQAQWQTLHDNMSTVWNLNSFGGVLASVLRHYASCIQNLPAVNEPDYVARLDKDLEYLKNGQSIPYNQFSEQLIRILEKLVSTIVKLNQSFSAVAVGSVTPEQLNSLKSKKDAPLTFEKYAVDLVVLLEYIRNAYQRFIGISPIDQALSGHKDQAEAVLQKTIAAVRSDQELSFWSQARYCHFLRIPYRRIADHNEALWWAAWETAERSLGTAVEPAAALLIEMLHSLGQDIFESRSLKDWIGSTLKVISASGKNIPPVHKRLRELASKDALGLPVTMMRLTPSTHLSIDIALPLEEKIDRGQWAVWIFRETLLDRYLGDEP